MTSCDQPLTAKTPASAARADAGRSGGAHDPDRARYGRWRAGTLLLVYALMTAHIIHWKVSGHTLAPLELNEVMYTFELGIVTAGFLFMVVAVLATAVFGRFFCSWGCHILALQDLCGWLLSKLRIHPKGVRSRMLLWVPFVAMLYMFVWPQAVRIWEGRAIPIMHLTSDADGWASFATDNFWRNLPGPGIIIATFLVCGFVIVYVLGSRGFCAYGCPYGAVFALVDRLAPGRIRVGDDCIQCGTCTSVCGSHIRVHEELNRYGTVVNPACMKDLDCVAACPQQSLHYGFGVPSLVQVAVSDGKVRQRYDFTLAEELGMGAAFPLLLVIFRGLYDTIPFLLSVGLAGIGSYGLVVALRLIRAPAVKFNRWQLKARGRMARKGWLFSGLAVLCLAVTVHGGIIRYHYLQGRRLYRTVIAGTGTESDAIARSTEYLKFVDRLGLLTTPSAVSMLAEMSLRAKDWPEAERHLTRLVGWSPSDAVLRARLGQAVASGGDPASAIAHYQASLALDPSRPETHFALAGVFFDTKDDALAMSALHEAIRLRPGYAKAHAELGAILIQRQEFPSGIASLREAIDLQSDYADAHYNLAVALAMTGHEDEALEEITIARGLDPDDEKSAAFERFLRERAASGR